jgi:hypothetical protein
MCACVHACLFVKMPRQKQSVVYHHDDDDDDDGVIDVDIHELISSKDISIENFLHDVIDSLPDPFSTTTTTNTTNMPTLELAKMWKEEAKKKIAHHSVILLHRVQPVIKLMLEHKLAHAMDQSFGTLQTFEPSLVDMVSKYQSCFNIWIDASDCVSFKATNERLLGKIQTKDMYILTFFAFLTCKRTKNDNVLQLGLVGCSTAGKSTLFEACLMEGCHVTTNENGVGRFEVGNKPILMFHDIDIRNLASSKDTEKIKTMARTEPTVTKVHSTVLTLHPMFLFYSSNERLMDHKFKSPDDGRPYLSQFYFSQVNQVGKKRISEDSLKAVQNRFIEAFVRTPPPLQQHDLPPSGGFQRIHAIFGLFNRVIALLQQYRPSDFYSPVLVQYVLHGLCLFSSRYEKGLNISVVNVLQELIYKHIKSELQKSILLLL